MARKLRIAALAFTGLLLLVAGLALYGYYASQTVPEFYQQAVARDTASYAEANDQCLQQVTALVSDVRRPGAWQAKFTAEQINGWLAVDLVRNYPDLLPPEIEAPRVAIVDRQATVGCRVTEGDLTTIFSLTVEVYLSEPNVVAIKLRGARAGALPMPLSKILDALSTAAAQADVPLRWMQADGDPVALVALADLQKDNGFGQCDAIELRDGALWISGHTAPKVNSPATPRATLTGERAAAEAVLSEQERPELERPDMDDDAAVQALDAEMNLSNQR